MPLTAKFVHGVLSTGDKCTLIGTFSPRTFIPTLKNGFATQHGRVGFRCLVIGEFINDTDEFNNVNISLTGMQEFFFPEGYKDLVKYSETPLLSIDTDFGKIEIGNNAKFGMLHSDISSQIYSHNKDALEKLKAKFDEIIKEFTNANFMLKKDIEYRIFYKFTKAKDIISIYSVIENISNLFSLLIFAPVYPESIKISHSIENQFPINLSIYPSIGLNKQTIDLALIKRSHFHMPLTKNSVNLSDVISKWLTTTVDYRVIVSSIQRETGSHDDHSLHGELVLYSTQLESISYATGEKQKKYEYPINQYATDKIRRGIRSIFSQVGESDIGKGIGDLRNEIVHVFKPKLLLGKLSIEAKAYLSQCMQVTIIGFILHQLGIERSVIAQYEDAFTPDLESS